jgi:hypothetical protein
MPVTLSANVDYDELVKFVQGHFTAARFDLFAFDELTRYSPSQRGLLLPGFRRIGHPHRRRISLQWQLGKFHWRDFHPLERQLYSRA